MKKLPLLLLLLLLCACTKRGPKDIGNQNPRSEFPEGATGSGNSHHATLDAGATSTDHVLAKPDVQGRKPRELAKASARAIITSKTLLYFGDAEDDALYSLPKKGGAEPSRLARRAPMPGALVIDSPKSGTAPDDESNSNARLFWIGNPGDIVLRMPIKGGSPTTLRDGAIFANIAVSKGDIFFTEVQSKGGALTRITGATAARLATFDGSPRGITVDDQHVFIATTTRLVDAPRQRDSIADLATGSGFASPQVDDTFVYATATNPKGSGRMLVRVKKMGGTLETIAENVRDAPIALHQGSLYWFDARRPALLSVSVANANAKGAASDAAKTFASPQTLSEDPLLEYVYGIAIDEDGAFVASGYGDGGRILAIPLR